MKGYPMFAPRGWLSRPVARRIYRSVASSELFDRHWYRRHNMAGATLLGDPVWHFLKHGHTRALDPGPHFDSEQYLQAYPDVKASRLNPLFHFLEYGVAERRHPLRSVRQTLEWLFPDARELPVFGVPRAGGARVSLVVDSATVARTDASLEEILSAGVALAAVQKASLRIISLVDDTTAVSDALTRALAAGPTVAVDVVSATAHTPTTHYDTFVGEVFLAASWTAAAAIRHAAHPDNLWCLVPGSLHPTTAVAIAPLPGLVPHSPKLWRRWSLLGAHHSGSSVTPRRGAVDIAPGGPVHLVVVANVHQHPVRYSWVLSEVEKFVLEHPLLQSRLQITIVGTGTRPLRILEVITPALRDDAPAGLYDTADIIIESAGHEARATSSRALVIEATTDTLATEGYLVRILSGALELTEDTDD